jgi:ppGpp synthetase/RelA/SpoT-type nucleotidyltranferase
MNLVSSYKERMPILQEVMNDIEKLLVEILDGISRKDRIETRVKAIDSFIEKASKKDSDEKPKYNYPLEEIQDQSGARIVVFYKSDVELAAKRILTEFREVQDRQIEQPDPEAFSYEARHFVCLIPPDIQARYKPPINFFELQISTLFQHAWAEANHDLGYKSPRDLSYGDRRRIAWAAAQAWGADMIFDEMWNRLRNA